jgi:hypothetical protein
MTKDMTYAQRKSPANVMIASHTFHMENGLVVELFKGLKSTSSQLI